MLTEQETKGWHASSDEERAAILEQLERILLDPSFNKSKRYPSLLRFVVDHALRGDTGSLKERILGIEVFGRSPDYDTTEDPIVRVTAAEIRKRILKYYDNPLHESELRLLLPTGSYIPSFTPAHAEGEPIPITRVAAVPETQPAPLHLPEASPSVASEPLPPVARNVWLRPLLAVAAVLLAVVAGVFYMRVHRKPAIDALWAPLLRSSKPVLICIADQQRNALPLMDAENPILNKVAETSLSTVSADSVSSLVDISHLFSTEGHAYHVQQQDRATLADLGGGPAVLVGAYNNIWTLRLTRGLRYHFANNEDKTELWIADTQAPSEHPWAIDMRSQNPEMHKDYALIARFIAPYTNQQTLVIAGLGHESNVEATRFVLSPESIAEIDKKAPRNWRNQNFEVVLEVSVLNGQAGHPRIEAVHTW